MQFSPADPTLILYNHEWPSADTGIRRMWLYDGKQHLRLRTEGEGRLGGDYVCHEMWERDGQAIIYHGGFKDGANFVGRVFPDGTELCEIPFPDGYVPYGHFTVGQPGVLISDGYYCEPDDDPQNGFVCGAWIARVETNWDKATMTWIPRCKNRSSWDSQDAHPHPIINNGDTHAYFTSDFEGKRAIYRIPLYDN